MIKRSYLERKARKAKRLEKRKQVFKRPVLPSYPKLKKMLWEVTAEYVRERDKRANNGLCITCNQYPIFSANHIIPQQDSLNTAYDPDNLYGGCIACNKSEFKRRSHWALYVFPMVFGTEKMLNLTLKSNIIVKFSRGELMEKINGMNRKLSELKNLTKT